METILDLARFPLHQPMGDDYQALVDRCRQQLAGEGAANLEGFLLPHSARAAVDQLSPIMANESFRHARWHNIYFKDVPELPEDHPALIKHETVNNTVCADQMSESIVCKIYEWPPLLRFLEAVLDKPKLHLMADPLARANVMAYRRGEALNWHFDRSEFTVTLLLQEAEAGGVFQYRPGLRNDADPNYSGVARLLTGEDLDVRDMPFAAGTLSIFKGKNTAHRVTPVEGPQDRMIAVYSYYETPGVIFSAEEQLGFYGRTA